MVPAPGRLELGLKLYTRENQIKKLTKAGTLPNHQLGTKQPETKLRQEPTTIGNRTTEI